eukprot:13645115-Alexandrium_andersonii.AAC.1
MPLGGGRTAGGASAPPGVGRRTASGARPERPSIAGPTRPRAADGGPRCRGLARSAAPPYSPCGNR